MLEALPCKHLNDLWQAQVGLLHCGQPNLDVGARREIPSRKTKGGRAPRSEELWCGRKHMRKLTLTLCGFLQCSLRTPSTVMLLGRITTSLLFSLHVNSHSSPRCRCAFNERGRKSKAGNIVKNTCISVIIPLFRV